MKAKRGGGRKKKEEKCHYVKGRIWLHLEDNKEEKCDLLSNNSDGLVSFCFNLSSYEVPTFSWMFFQGSYSIFLAMIWSKSQRN